MQTIFRTRWLSVGLALWCSLSGDGASRCQADLIRLKSGGDLRGKILPETLTDARELSVRTVTGALVTVSREQVDFITRRSLTYEEYELKARLADQTVAAQWELADWCVSRRLMPQREKHLEAVLELDPENAQAHKALGHVLREGRWTTQEEDMLARGYVKHQGRYITPEEKSLLENSQLDRQLQLAWYEKLKIWSNWLTGRYEKQRQQAIDELRQIDDPYAIPALQNFLAEQPDREVRLIYIATLKQIAAPEAMIALVKMAVLDGDQGVRAQAREAIPEDQSGQAVGELIAYLQHSDNQVVRRAGSALRSLGNQKAVPYLIEALVTSHKYRVAVERPPVGVSLGPGGQVGGLQPPVLPPELYGALMTGMISPDAIIPARTPVRIQHWKTVRLDQQNPEVLEALREMTQVDFGYDKRTWKLWLMSQKS